jgi:hypothetical protein
MTSASHGIGLRRTIRAVLRPTPALIGLTLIAACGGGDNGSNPGGPVVPVPTGPGTPTGEGVTAVVGPQGGQIASADGRLTVEIPAGALGEVTELSVVPIATLAPNGVGAAYRLGPEGTTFAQPATLRFHYGPTDTAGSAPDLLAVTFQDASGYWHVPDNQTLDATAGTLSVKTTHFSDWSLLQDVQIQPASASVRNDAALPVSLIACFREEVVMQNDGPRYVCRQGEPRRFTVSRWAVNGQTGGSATVGTVRSGGAGRAVYQAPHRAPTPNVVQVTAELGGANGARALVFASVAVYDDSFTVEGRWQAVVTYSHTRVVEGGSTYQAMGMVEATLVGHMGAAIVTESGMASFESTEVNPLNPGECTTTIKGAGPLAAYAASPIPNGALSFLPVTDDSEHYYYFIGVPFGVELSATQDIVCVAPGITDSDHYDITHGFAWLMIPSQFTSDGYKVSRSLDSMSGTYEQLSDGLERWTWTITRVAGSN